MLLFTPAGMRPVTAQPVPGLHFVGTSSIRYLHPFGRWWQVSITGHAPTPKQIRVLVLTLASLFYIPPKAVHWR